MFNETWWAPTERNFVHPDYPADWPVEVLNMGAVDGPDARISATITLVDAATIEVRLVRGDLVAVYSPTTDIFLCG